MTHEQPRVHIERLEQHTDPRGSVFEPMGAAELAAQKNVHVVLTEPGAVRGNHLHRRSTETLVVRGPARLRYRAGGTARDVDVEAGDVVSFTFPPGVPHALVNTGTEPQLLVAFRDTEHDPADPDVERVELGLAD